MKLKIFLPLILFLVFLSSLWWGRFSFAKYSYMRKFFKESPAKTLKAVDSEMQKDREALARYALFYPSSGDRDAGPFLNPTIRWEIGPKAHRGSLVLPEGILKELSGSDWVTKKPLFKKMGARFDWMKELHEFDVWSFEKGSPVYEEGVKYHTYSFPLPSYQDLKGWAKLRYLYGKKTGDVGSALKDVRQLMRLIYTNDTIISSMVTLELLKIENQYEEVLTPKEIGDWKFIPHEHIMRAKRLFHALPAGVDIRLSDEAFDKHMKTNVGLCAMVFEGLLFYLSYRDYLKEELNYGYKRMDEALKNLNCRKTILHQMWNDHSWETTPLQGREFTLFGRAYEWEEVKNIPSLKAAMGYKEAAAAEPHFVIKYDVKD